MATEKNPFEPIPDMEEITQDNIEIEEQDVATNPESVMMMDDGSAVVDLTGKPAMMSEEEMEGGHYDNLVPFLDETELDDIASEVIEKYTADKSSRGEWEQTFGRGFDLLGLKLKETSEPFEGACTAVHPLLIESAVKFQSKASQEFFALCYLGRS